MRKTHLIGFSWGGVLPFSLQGQEGPQDPITTRVSKRCLSHRVLIGTLLKEGVVLDQHIITNIMFIIYDLHYYLILALLLSTPCTNVSRAHLVGCKNQVGECLYTPVGPLANETDYKHYAETKEVSPGEIDVLLPKPLRARPASSWFRAGLTDSDSVCCQSLELNIQSQRELETVRGPLGWLWIIPRAATLQPNTRSKRPHGRSSRKSQNLCVCFVVFS